MTYNEYTNIDGETNEITSWYLTPYDDYGSNLGYREYYQKGYTQIREIPKIDGDYDAYWVGEPYLQTKLGTNNEFITSYAYTSSSLKVFVNGVIVLDEYITITGDTTFTVNTAVGDGFMYVDYYPQEAEYCMGDHTAEVNALMIRGTYYTGPITPEDITRCRKAINAMQIQSDYVPTNWIGGANNDIKSGAQNIIKGVTRIYGEHIIEIQDSLVDLAYHLSSLTTEENTPVVVPTFTIVVNSNNYSVQWIEEIRLAINTLENNLIDILST